MWLNYLNDDGMFSRKTSFILLMITLVVFVSFVQKDVTVECTGALNMCKLKKTNVLNITSTKNLFLAKDIMSTDIDSYRKARAKRLGTARNVTRYKLFLISRTGKRILLYKDYGYAERARQAGADIMTCIKSEQYPCKIKIY